MVISVVSILVWRFCQGMMAVWRDVFVRDDIFTSSRGFVFNTEKSGSPVVILSLRDVCENSPAEATDISCKFTPGIFRAPDEPTMLSFLS